MNEACVTPMRIGHHCHFFQTQKAVIPIQGKTQNTHKYTKIDFRPNPRKSRPINRQSERDRIHEILCLGLS